MDYKKKYLKYKLKYLTTKKLYGGSSGESLNYDYLLQNEQTTVDNPTQTYPTPELPKQTDIPSTMFGRDVIDMRTKRDFDIHALNQNSAKKGNAKIYSTEENQFQKIKPKSEKLKLDEDITSDDIQHNIAETKLPPHFNMKSPEGKLVIVK